MPDIDPLKINSINNQAQAPAQAPKIAQDDFDASVFENYFANPDKSAGAEFDISIDDFFDLFEDNHAETQDGVIDETRQQQTGDCWLLSGINALSYTEDGRQIINDALDYQDNGDIVIHFKGVDDYTVTKQEIDQARKDQNFLYSSYSKGDDDMLAFELGVEKLYDDIAYGKVKLEDAPWHFEDADGIKTDIIEDGKSIEGGNEAQLMYFITGKEANYLYDREDMESALGEFDGKTVALGASIDGDITMAKDINGKNVLLPGGHAYAIKDVDGDSVTVTNPWDSGKEIVLSKDEFLDKFDDMYKCDLASDDVNYVKKYEKTTQETEVEDFITYTDIFGNNIKPAHSQETKDVRGNKIEEALVDADGNKLKATEWGVGKDDTYYMKAQKSYFQDGAKAAGIVYDENGDISSYRIEEYDEAGKIKTVIDLSQKQTFDNLSTRDLFSYEQFSLKDIKELAGFSNKQWNIAKEYLENHQDATFQEIYGEVCNKTLSTGRTIYW